MIPADLPPGTPIECIDASPSYRTGAAGLVAHRVYCSWTWDEDSGPFRAVVIDDAPTWDSIGWRRARFRVAQLPESLRSLVGELEPA